ncbi:MAG: hypothetical protein LUB83_00055 [Prevotellaceae bacterium]|nr:hypothetical protein [Prevotellaceae bacterium]
MDKKTLQKKFTKELIRKAKENGSIDRLNRLLSAAHLINCVANDLIEEGSELMERCGLKFGELRHNHRMFTQRADMYFDCFAKLVNTDKQKECMFRDMEKFENWFRDYAGLTDRKAELPEIVDEEEKEAKP